MEIKGKNEIENNNLNKSNDASSKHSAIANIKDDGTPILPKTTIWKLLKD